MALACFSLEIQSGHTKEEGVNETRKCMTCLCHTHSLGDGGCHFRNTEMDLEFATHEQSDMELT